MMCNFMSPQVHPLVQSIEDGDNVRWVEVPSELEPSYYLTRVYFFLKIDSGLGLELGHFAMVLSKSRDINSVGF